MATGPYSDEEKPKTIVKFRRSNFARNHKAALAAQASLRRSQQFDEARDESTTKQEPQVRASILPKWSPLSDDEVDLPENGMKKASRPVEEIAPDGHSNSKKPRLPFEDTTPTINVVPDTPSVIPRKNLFGGDAKSMTMTNGSGQMVFSRPGMLGQVPKSQKAAANKKKGSRKPNNRQLKQLYLDIGQQNFEAVKCKGCGMIYTPGPDDVVHDHYHKSLKSSISFEGWKNERVVSRCSDGGRIVAVSRGDHEHHKRKIDEVKEIMDRELGMTYNWQTDLVDARVYLYITSDKKVAGCVVAERLETAMPLERKEGSSSSYTGNVLTDQVNLVDCGIRQMWVHKIYRKQGIATRLVDAVRETMLVNYVVPKDKIAFSQPTEDGKRFASEYIGKELAIKVY